MAQLHTSKGTTVRTISRRTAIAVSAVAAAALATPAFAAPTATPTSLNLRANKSVVRVHHTVDFTATLSSKGKGVSGESTNMVVQERTAPTTGHRTTWQDQTMTVITDAGNGKYTFHAAPPLPSSKKSQKDQYRLVFKGDTASTPHYAKSHSEIVTVTVKRS